MITPRTTRLIRTANLDSFRHAVVALATQGAPADIRDRLIVLPTRAAGSLLVGVIERALPALSATVYPAFATADEVAARVAERAAPALGAVRPEAREVLMAVACRAASAIHPAPFALRPGLIAEMVAFYDSLLRRRRDISTFERLALSRLEPGAEYDRGAERLVRQTRFLVAAFGAFRQLAQERGLVDEHVLREAAIASSAAQPWRHAVVTVGDESRDPYGLSSADWDLLTRVAGLERLDVLVTDGALAGAWHEHVHQLLPGIEEVRFEGGLTTTPVLRVPPASTSPGGRPPDSLWRSRDREEEVADFARWVRTIHRGEAGHPLDRIALVVRQPLPYAYLGREVLRSAGVPCQTFDALPLAAEPYAAALDLVLSVARTDFARAAGVALLRSPHFIWTEEAGSLSLTGIARADEVLVERGYLGGIEPLRRIAGEPSGHTRGASEAAPALRALAAIAGELESLHTAAPAADHLNTILRFLRAHGAPIAPEDADAGRRRRARAAIDGIITQLRDAFRELDDEPVAFDRVEAILKRWIESHTFTPRVGDGGVYVVDAETARFGDFSHVQIAGLVEGEWPERPRRNIFYGAALLRDLGWSSATEYVDHARAAFADLIRLPSAVVTVSTFAIEDEAIATPSSLADLVDAWDGRVERALEDDFRIFDDELLGVAPLALDVFEEDRRAAARRRLGRPSAADGRFHGQTHPHQARAFSLSGLERYQDCPFKYFAADVLRLRDLPEDEPFLSPRNRGRFIHEVFQRFFEAWGASGARSITVDNLAQARTLFREVASPMLDRLNESDAALERARLFGSAIAGGIVDVVLGLEAASGGEVRSRWLEWAFEGEFSLGAAAGVRIPLRGVADRVDLLEGRRLRVVDYKTGYAPSPRRALQVPVYAMCAREQLSADGDPWTIDSAAYIAFSGKRALVPVIGAGDDAEEVLSSARERLLQVVAGVADGSFPPRPHEPTICRSCAYPAVCRKDFVDADA